jgi:hypothetical protein
VIKIPKRLTGFIFVLFLTGCGLNSSANTSSATPVKSASGVSQRPDQDCEKWERLFALLSPEDQDIVEKNGILSGRQGWIISEKLIPDCDLRVNVANYLDHYRESDNEEVTRFANENSAAIIDTLRRVWNSPYFSVDGNRSEKYMLLLAKGLRDEDRESFIKELLVSEGIQNNDDNQLDYVLFKSPIPSAIPLLDQLLKEAEVKNDFAQQARLLILIERASGSPKLLPKLEKIASNKALSSKARSKLSMIISKMKKAEEISYDDIDEFNLAEK